MTMKNITRSEFVVISLMLFSMFFGAGNFIFPPMLGKESGVMFSQTILYFCATAVVLPVLGVAAVARCGSVQALTSRVDNFFGPIFIVSIYLSIGPFLAIPRAANLPFEVGIAPLIAEESKWIWLAIWTIVFFVINYFISINKSKIVEILGRYLTPALLILIAVLVIAVFIAPTPPLAEATGSYATAPTSTAFMAGYDTMDAMASIVFGIVVVEVLRGFGVKDEKTLVSTTIKTGIFAGVILSLIYIALAYLGAATAGVIGEVENGAQILAKTAAWLFGKSGAVILGVALFLACITTTIGLTTSGSDYFNSLVPRVGYKTWCLIFSVVSALMANIGLSGILKFGVPILVAFYPVVIVLVLLALIDHFIDSSKLVYRSCIYVTLVTGLIYSLGSVAKVLPEGFVNAAKTIMPFYDYGLGWVLWVIVVFCVSYIIHAVLTKKIA